MYIGEEDTKEDFYGRKGIYCMTNEQFYEMLGNINGKYITEAKKSSHQKSKKRIFPAAAAALTVCLCLTGLTALAGTEKIKGYFKDIRRWDGAVTGTTYEQATEEIAVWLTVTDNMIFVELQIQNPDVPPYREFDKFGIRHYEITDEQGNILQTEDTDRLAALSGSCVSIGLPLNTLTSGNYILHIDELVGDKKADQPLALHGCWECSFTIK